MHLCGAQLVASGPGLFFTAINIMAKPNYQFEKRKRDMEKKAKKEEKKKRKLAAANAPSAENVDGEAASSEPKAE